MKPDEAGRGPVRRRRSDAARLLDPARVQVTAHRGSSGKAPENTLAALRQAISDGADYAEIDVRETADGQVVLLHDADLMRVAGLSTKVWEAGLDDLRRVDVGSWFSPRFANARIPTLNEALQEAQSRIGLNIELKINGHERHLAESVVELVRSAQCAETCIITSQDQASIARVRELAPEIRIGWIVTDAIGDVGRLDLDLLSMRRDQVTKKRVHANRAAGLATHVWTVDDENTMVRMIGFGVDSIITNRPARLRALIRRRACSADDKSRLARDPQLGR
jgi:glycerophosphoryl diester phosphodiesterase